MVNGLERFRAWFEGYSDQYVLIGGTAASIAMEDAGQNFRQTKDFDIVLHLEVLTPSFGRQFWDFVEAGGYQIRQTDSNVKPKLHRFTKPIEQDFPYMVELFARAPAAIKLTEQSKLTPIPIDTMVSSLSAILLEDVYYEFLMAGRRYRHGLPWVGEDRLIPLKAIAWLNLTDQKAAGEKIDSKNISKHLKDILTLASLLNPSTSIKVNAKIASDLRRFIEAASATDVMGQNQKAMSVFNRLIAAYNLHLQKEDFTS